MSFEIVEAEMPSRLASSLSRIGPDACSVPSAESWVSVSSPVALWRRRRVRRAVAARRRAALAAVDALAGTEITPAGLVSASSFLGTRKVYTDGMAHAPRTEAR